MLLVLTWPLVPRWNLALVPLIQPFLIPAVAKMVVSYLHIDQLCYSAISATGELLLSVWSDQQHHEFGFVDPSW